MTATRLLVLVLLCSNAVISSFAEKLSCPFPVPETIEPCSCLVDTETEEFVTHLVCDMQQDFTEKILRDITNAYGCARIRMNVDINMNHYKFVTDFHFEKFEMTSFHLHNYSLIAGNITSETFTASKLSLEEFLLEPAKENLTMDDGMVYCEPEWGGYGYGVEVPEFSLETGKMCRNSGLDTEASIQSLSFANMTNLKTIKLGNTFTTISRDVFSSLPKLQAIHIEKRTLTSIESGAFKNLVALHRLDLSDQLLEEIPGSAFLDLKNITSIDLSGNNIKIIRDDAFTGLPNLVMLDLRNNSICFVGNIFSKLTNHKLEVDLSNNNMKYLLEENFKPFVERSRGHVDLGNNPLQCGCDTLWLVSSNFNWQRLLVNSSCQSGEALEKVNIPVLEKICPKNDCENYSSAYGKMRLAKFEKLASGELNSPNYPNAYPNAYRNSWTLNNTQGTLKISFIDFKTELDYDTVTIKDATGVTLLSSHSGLTIPSPIKTNSSKALISFNTDSSNQNSGWKLKWEVLGVVYDDENEEFCDCCTK